MTAEIKGESLTGSVLTSGNITAYPLGCQIEDALIGAAYRLKPSSFLSSTGA